MGFRLRAADAKANGRFVLELAHSAGLMEALNPLLDNLTLDPATRARRIATVFAGLPKSMFEKVAKQIPLWPSSVKSWGGSGDSTAHDGAVRAVALSSDGTRAVSGGDAGFLKIWSTVDGDYPA